MPIIVAFRKHWSNARKMLHEWAQRLDMLQFQVNEISEAQLHEGEEEELQEQKHQLDNYQTNPSRLRDELSSTKW